MTYDPQQHHRRSIRLKGYDYTQAGAYFLTLCVQAGRTRDPQHPVGHIPTPEMPQR